MRTTSLASSGGSGRELEWIRRRRVELLDDQVHRVVAAERQLRGQHLVGQDAERVDVRAAVHRFAARLLGRHVRGRADEDAGFRRADRLAIDATAGELREAEVEQLHRALAPFGDEHDVVALEIAMDDLRLVRGLQRVTDHVEDLDRFGGGTGPRSINEVSGSPSSHSMMKKLRLSGSSPNWNTSTMFGCLISLTNRASCSNRATTPDRRSTRAPGP